MATLIYEENGSALITEPTIVVNRSGISYLPRDWAGFTIVWENEPFGNSELEMGHCSLEFAILMCGTISFDKHGALSCFGCLFPLRMNGMNKWYWVPISRDVKKSEMKWQRESRATSLKLKQVNWTNGCKVMAIKILHDFTLILSLTMSCAAVYLTPLIHLLAKFLTSLNFPILMMSTGVYIYHCIFVYLCMLLGSVRY